MPKNVLFQDPEFQIVDLGTTKVVLSTLDSLSIGENTDFGADFPDSNVVIYAENIIISKRFNAKSLCVSAFSITQSPDGPEIKGEAKNSNISYLQTTENLALQNAHLIRLFDYNNAKSVAVTATSLPGALIRVEEIVNLGLDNIDLTSFMFAHPAQCTMLLQKAQWLYREADPITNKRDLDQAIILLNRLRDRTKIFKDLAADSPLAALYNANEKNIGALGSLDTLKNIHNTANNLIGQIAKGSDYYGNSYQFVPLASFSFYKNILDSQIKNFSSIENTSLQFFNAEREENQRLQDLRNSRQTLDNIIATANTQIQDLKIRIQNAESDIAALQNQFKDKKKDVEDKMTNFQNALDQSFFLEMQSLFSSLTTLAFLSESPAGWVLAGSQIGYDIYQGAHSVKNDEGIVINTDYLVGKMKQFEGDLKSDNLSEQVNKLDDGIINYSDPGANKLIAEENALDSFLSGFYIKFPEGAKELQQAFANYVDLVLARNNKILYYNAMVTIIINNHDTIKDANSKKEILNDQNLRHYQPNLPAFTSLMTSLYLNAQAQVMSSLYLTERAFRFWSLSDLRPISTLFSNKKIIDIDQAVLASAENQILAAYFSAVENYGLDAQKFPAHSKDRGIIWDLSQSDIDDLKTASDGEYSVLFTIPASMRTTEKKDNPFGSYANVRLTVVRAWLEGASTYNNQIILSLTHTGTEVVINTDDEEFKFNHDLRKVGFEYNLTSNTIFEDGIIGCSDKDGTYALVGPFTWWQLSIKAKDNVGLDLSKLTKVSIEFHGTNYSF